MMCESQTCCLDIDKPLRGLTPFQTCTNNSFLILKVSIQGLKVWLNVDHSLNALRVAKGHR